MAIRNKNQAELDKARDNAELLVIAVEGLGARAGGLYGAANGKRDESICAEDFHAVVALAHRLHVALIALAG